MRRLVDAAAVVVLIAALGVRLAQLDQFIASDELKWTCRSLNFGAALAAGRPAGTFQTGHPGVVTMWLGTLAVPPGTAPKAMATCVETTNGAAPAAAKAEALAGLAETLFQMRTSAAIFNWLLLAPIYLVARRLFGASVALAGLALVAFDPFLLAHSRVLHLDGALSGLLTLSALTLLAAVIAPARESGPRDEAEGVYRPRARWAAASGVLAGVALAQKVAAVLVWPWVGVVLLAAAWRARSVGLLARLGVVWALALVVGLVAVWPAVWANPVGTVQGVVAKAEDEGGNPHASGQFVGEEIVDDPGPLMYGLTVLFRASPWALLGLVLVLPRLRAGARGHRGTRASALAGVLGFALVFAVLIAVSPKKFDRYLLPVFPPLDLLAGAGLALVARRGARRWAVTLVVAGTQALLVLPHAPYYLTYYNPLLGGGATATRWLLVGWGEGYDQAAAYLNGLPGATETQVAVRGVSNFGPLFVGETRSAPGYRPYQTDYVVLYSNEVQRRRNEGLIARYMENPAETPVHVVRMHGIDYAWVYRNTTADAPLQYLSQGLQTGDALVVHGASQVAKRAPSVPTAPVYGHFGAMETAEALAKLPDGTQRVWYARYPGADPGIVLDALLEHGILEDRRQFPDMEVLRFRSAPPARQTADADFGAVRLVGWGATELQPGRPEGVTLQWRVSRAAQEELVAVLEVLDAEGGGVAVAEKPLRDATLTPATKWTAGATTRTVMPFTLPPGTPPGAYTLRLRLRGNGGWLPVGTAARADVALGTVTVARAAPMSDAALGQLVQGIPTRLETDLGATGLRLLGHGLKTAVTRPGAAVEVPLWWQATGQPPFVTLDLGVRDVRGERAATTGGVALLPAPLSPPDWRPGEVYGATRRAPVAADAPTGPGQVELNLRDAAGRSVLPAPIVLGALWIQGSTRLSEFPRQPGQRVDYRVANASLVGYDAAQLRPGGPLHVTLYWRAGGPTPTPYSVFVHLLAADGSIVTQVDRAPGLGHHATTQWQAGEAVVDPYTLAVPDTRAAGPYRLALGWYDATGTRAPARDAQGRPVADDRILLDVEVR